VSTQESTKPRFSEAILTRPPAARWDVVTTLAHFAIVTYAVDPERVRPHLHPRFQVETFPDADGSARAWISMVPFEDQDFRFGIAPWLRFKFGQTNYRTYVIDSETGQRAVWFFGTCLDSSSVFIPRYLWQLPWHHGRIRFDCAYDPGSQTYSRYRMTTASAWAPVELELKDSGQPVRELRGRDDLEATLVTLTHPLLGAFYRRDGALGSYRIWHDRLALQTASCLNARIGLLDRLELVPFAQQLQPHSVLLQHQTEFTIYLPPRRLSFRG
jgi:hypothetical protein